jgi:hypothetical protein
VVQVKPPEVLTVCPAADAPPRLPALPAGATVPRPVVVQRDVATGRYLAGVLKAHATCRANAAALRRLYGFDAAPAPAAATSARGEAH